MALGDTVTRLGASALLLGRQRLELAALDVEEELLRLGGLLAAVLVTSLLTTLALAALAAVVVVCFWDTARLAALVGVAGAFALAAGASYWRLRQALRTKPAFLAATLAEFQKDAQALGPKP